MYSESSEREKARAAKHRAQQRAKLPAFSQKAKAPTFRGANLEIQSFTGSEWMLSGPAETGKTWAALWRLDSLLRSTPRVKATLARKTQSTIYGTVLVTFEAIQELRSAMGDYKALAFGGEKPQWYTYANGSRLWVGGLDNPQKILSAERDYIYINQAEEVTLQDWEYCITRTTGRGSVVPDTMVMGDCNPGAEDHWIQKRETLRVFYSKHKDNPSLYTDAGELTPQGIKSITALKSLTGIRKKRLYEGLWVGAEGLFFEEFDPDDPALIVEPFKISLDWPIWGSLDYGFKHPLAFGLFTEDNDGHIYLIAEHIKNKLLIPFHAKAIYELYSGLKIPPELVSQIVAGHDVFKMDGGTDEEDAKTKAQKFLAACDPETGEPLPIILEHADIDRKQGATELLTRLGNREMNVRPTLHIFSTCRRTIATLSRMVQNPRDPEDVLKVNADPLTGEGGDDAYDMLRYGVMARVNTSSNAPAVGGIRSGYQVQ